MEDTEKEEREKTTTEETVNIKMPRQVLDFAEFYAEIGSTDRDALLTRILIERLKEIKEQFMNLPYLQIPELW